MYDDDLDNPLGFTDDTKGVMVSMIPIYSSKYGGIYLEYKEAELNGQFENDTGSTMQLWSNDEGTVTQILPDIADQAIFQTKDKVIALEIAYIFPEVSFLPKGFTISYTEAERAMVMVMRNDDFNVPYLLYSEGDSDMLGIGISRDRNSISHGFLLRKLKYSTGTLEGQNSITTEEISIGLSYITQKFYLDLDFSRYQASATPFVSGGQNFSMPTNVDEIVLVKVGISF